MRVAEMVGAREIAADAVARRGIAERGVVGRAGDVTTRRRLGGWVVLALAPLLGAGCFHHPKVNGDDLLCMNDDGCLAGYVCTKQPGDVTQAFGHCVRPDAAGVTGGLDGAVTEAGAGEAGASVESGAVGDAQGAFDGGGAAVDGGAVDGSANSAGLKDAAGDGIPSTPLDGSTERPSSDAPATTGDVPFEMPLSQPDAPITGNGGAGGSGGQGGGGGGVGGGGIVGAGGIAAAGGAVASGGVTGAGGVVGAGGDSATGGAAPSGGATGTGGTGGATGTPPNLKVSTASVSLGSVATGESSAPGSFTITNIGQQTSGPLSISSTNAVFVIQSGGAGDCVNGATTLAQGASCTVRVVFSPTTVGDQSALIMFSADPGNGDALTVSGTGTPGAALSTTTTALTYGLFMVGTSSPVQSFTISNTGPRNSGALTVSSNSSDFVVQSGDPADCTAAPIPTSGSCTVRVVFTPTTGGTRSGTVSFSAAPGSGGSVAVSGSACAAGTHDGGDGTCVAQYICASGYHNGGTGKCVINASCPTDQLTDDSGTCVPVAGVNWTPIEGSPAGLLLMSMSPDGLHVFAASNTLFTSADSGLTWTSHGAAKNWLSVASSSDGVRLVATSVGIDVSGDSGNTWTTRGPTLTFSSVAGSSDGMKLVAGPSLGYIHTSSDYGTTWIPQEQSGVHNWHSLASSADGTVIAATVDGKYIYTSEDSGVSWVDRQVPVASWQYVCGSLDGTKFLAGSLTLGSYLYHSVDSGRTWTGINSNRPPRSLACSGNGSTFLVGTLADSANNINSYITIYRGAGGTQRAPNRFSWQALAASADGTRLVANDGFQVYTSNGPVP